MTFEIRGNKLQIKQKLPNTEDVEKKISRIINTPKKAPERTKMVYKMTAA